MLYRGVENGVIDRVFRPNSKYLVGEALFCVEIYRDFFAWELRSKIISRSEPASNEKFRNEQSPTVLRRLPFEFAASLLLLPV